MLYGLNWMNSRNKLFYKYVVLHLVVITGIYQFKPQDSLTRIWLLVDGVIYYVAHYSGTTRHRSGQDVHRRCLYCAPECIVPLGHTWPHSWLWQYTSLVRVLPLSGSPHWTCRTRLTELLSEFSDWTAAAGLTSLNRCCRSWISFWCRTSDPVRSHVV